jgi:hypothetical protein
MTPDPCPTCGAAMAADQRYCLSCGNRRAEARLDYLEVLRGRPVATAAGTPAAAPSADARQRVNTTVIASIGCLLLAMGVGVLIGNSGNGDKAGTPVAAPAQVIKVQGGGAATADTASSGSAAKSKAKKSSKKSSSSDVQTAKTAADSKATNPTLKQLDSTSGSDYSKQSQKLPKTVSTGGKAPPIDKSKPAGGGTSSESIG